MEKVAICALAFVASALAQFPTYTAAYPRVLADTIPDSSLVLWQIPPFTGTAKLRSMSWADLLSAGSGGCDNGGFTGTGACVRATSPTITTPTLSGTTNSAKIVSSDTLVGIGVRSSGDVRIGNSVGDGRLNLRDNGYRKGFNFERLGVAGTRVFQYVGDGTNGTVADEFYTDLSNTDWHIRAGGSGNVDAINVQVSGKVVAPDTVVATGGFRSARYNTGGVAATFGGKLTSSDTLVGLGIRSANYNAGALAATFGGKLSTSDTLVAGRGLRTPIIASSGVKSSFTGGLYGDTVVAYYNFKWTTAGASVKSAYWNGTTLASGTISGTGTTFTTTASPTFTGTVGAAKIVATDTVVSVGARMSGLTGVGAAYACLDANGKLYRSATACL